jgi:hypothetical protein
MSWICTWTGRQVYPLDPKPDQICLEDIAHGLAHKCRYNGQSLFYSVAEHCVHMADWCLWGPKGADYKLLALQALMHDAAEAYLPDVTSPIKVLFPDFERHEEKLLAVIFEALGIPRIHPSAAKVIKSIDKRIILNERARVLPNHNPEVKWPVEHLVPLQHTQIFCWPPDEALDNFMNRYKELTSSGDCDHPWKDRQVSGDEAVCAACGKRWPIAKA